MSKLSKTEIRLLAIELQESIKSKKVVLEKSAQDWLKTTDPEAREIIKRLVEREQQRHLDSYNKKKERKKINF